MRGHVRERGKGNWYAVLSTRDPQTGKRKVRWRSLPNCKGKREAQQECARIITEMQSGGYVAPDKTTVAQFLERWLNHIRTQVSPNSAARYERYVHSNIMPLLGGVRLSRLRPEMVSEAYASARARLSPQTVKGMATVLKAALGRAVSWRMIQYNPAADVRAPKVERREMHTLDAATTAELIEEARGTKWFMPVLLGAMCGLRRGEMCGLRWGSVDLKSGQLSVSTQRVGTRLSQPKNGRGRLIALPLMVVTELRKHRLRQSEGLLRLGIKLNDETFVCAREDCEPLLPATLTKLFGRFLRRHELPQIRLHDLRHIAATLMLASGVHPKIAQEQLGHSSISTTMDIYSHAMPNMQAEAVARLDAVMQAALNKRDTK